MRRGPVYRGLLTITVIALSMCLVVPELADLTFARGRGGGGSRGGGSGANRSGAARSGSIPHSAR